jgi:hypothetical protein
MTDADETTAANEVVTLPVPDVVSAIYLVPTTVDPPWDVRGVIQRRLGGSFDDKLRGKVRAWLSQPIPPLHVRTVAETPLPMELLAISGASNEQLRRFAKATHVVLVEAHSKPGASIDHEHVARAMAVLVADELSSDVIDILTYATLTPDQARATMPANAKAPLAEWVAAEYSPDRHGYWCTTNGLRRFGLPELQTLTTPPNVVEQWGSAMTGISVALLAVWQKALWADPDAAFVQLPALLTVSADNVAQAYGRRPEGGPTAQVRITLDPRGPDRHSFLTIQPPLHWSGSAGEHISTVCAALFGPRATTVRETTPSDAMDEAIANARSGLTEIRSRFESGQLDLRTKLLVKYALPAQAGTEYLWAYVTSWRDPYRILATSAAAAVYHPKVKAGRPVVVDTSSVVDWAVEHDELGIIEGGWTQAALDDEHGDST